MTDTNTEVILPETATETVADPATETATETVTDPATETVTDSATETIAETVADTATETIAETAPEPATDTPSGDYIPDAMCVELDRFDEAMLKKTFPASRDTRVTLCEDGVLFTATGASDDPGVTFNLSDMYKAAGYEQNAAGSYVPFTPKEVSGVVLKVRASRSGILELFWAAGDLTEATAGCSASAA